MALISISIVQAFSIQKNAIKNWESHSTITVISTTACNVTQKKQKLKEGRL